MSNNRSYESLEELLQSNNYYKDNILLKIQRFFVETYYSFRNFIKYRLIYKLRYGFDVRDIWELDVVISKYIISNLDYLKNDSSIKDITFILESIEKYIEDDQYNNYNDAQEAYNKLYKIISNKKILENEEDFINFVVPRIQYLDINGNGYATFSIEQIKNKKLESYVGISEEETWHNILMNMVNKFKSNDSRDRIEAFRIMTEVIFNLWD